MRHLTIVFDVDRMTEDEVALLTAKDSAVYLAWGHIPYERDALKGELDRIKNLELQKKDAVGGSA